MKNPKLVWTIIGAGAVLNAAIWTGVALNATPRGTLTRDDAYVAQMRDAGVDASDKELIDGAKALCEQFDLGVLTPADAAQVVDAQMPGAGGVYVKAATHYYCPEHQQ